MLVGVIQIGITRKLRAITEMFVVLIPTVFVWLILVTF